VSFAVLRPSILYHQGHLPMSLKCFNWAIALSLVWPFHGAIATAQIVPDSTLPVNSIVTPDGSTLTIDGGSIAGTNLFHSFEIFSVPANGEAVFNNPVAIENIFTRVTGNSISNIDGLLQTQGTANLFFLNPNGIVFGPNSRLEIGGSFIGTTAESVAFADGFQFSTSNPNETPLLTVSVPVGLQFGTSSGTIINRSRSVEDTGTIVGLQGNVGETLGLMGSDVRLEGGYLTAPGGAIALGSIASGEVSLNLSASGFNFDYTTVGNLGTIDLSGGAVIDSSADTSGAIDLRGSQINLTGESRIVAVTNIGDGGDVTIAGDRFFLGDRSAVIVATQGAGNGGNLSVTASEAIDLVGTGERLDFVDSFLLGTAKPMTVNSGLYAMTFADGDGGSIAIDTGSLSIRDGMFVATATMQGSGTGGDLSVNVADAIEVSGIPLQPGMEGANIDIIEGGEVNDIVERTSNELTTGLLSITTSSQGNGGNLTIRTRSLETRNNSFIGTATLFFGRGDGGNLQVDVSNEINILDRSSLFAITASDGNAGTIAINASEIEVIDKSVIFGDTIARGNASNITVNTDRLLIDEQSQLTASNANTILGAGSAGSVTVNATEFVEILNRSGIFTQGRSNKDSGNIAINTGRLIIRANGGNSAGISTLTVGDGIGGDILINATESVEIVGDEFTTPFMPSAFTEEILPQFLRREGELSGIATYSVGAGEAGNVTINTRDLAISTNAGIITFAAGSGSGGDLTIRASDSVAISDLSVLLTSTFSEGKAGNLFIETENLMLTRGSAIAADTIRLRNPAILLNIDEDLIEFTQTGEFLGSGDAGDLTIVAENFTVEGGSIVSAITGSRSTGEGGTLTIQADSIEVTGTSADGETASAISVGSRGAGDAGNLNAIANNFTIRDGAEVSVSGRGEGAAGNLNITGDRLRLDNGNITADTITGNFGNINLQMGTLQLRNLSSITTNATGIGGNIVIITDTLAALKNSDITANSRNSFGGRVSIESLAIVGTAFRDSLTPQSDITATSDRGPEFSGTVILETPDVDCTSGILETPRLEAIAPLRDPCARVARTETYSTFYNIGNGGSPPNPSDAIDLDRLPDSNSSYTEAQGWIVDDNGIVSLTVDSTGVTPYSSQQTPVPGCENLRWGNTDREP